MRKNSVISLEKSVFDYLVKKDINPFSVTYTTAMKNSPFSDGALSITTYTELDLRDLLALLNYDSLCDRSGVFVIEENNTVILSGMGIMSLWCDIQY